MTNLMTTKNLLGASILAILTGCGSGSDGDSGQPINPVNEGGEINKSDLPKVNFPKIATGEINDQNVESVISEVYQLNEYWLNELRYKLENVDLELGNSVTTASYPNGSSDLSDLCDRGGSYLVEFYSVTSLQDGNGSRVHGAGDYIDIDFAQCGADFLHSGYYISGSHRYDILSGYFDGYDYIAENTTVKETYENRVLDYGTYNLDDLESFVEFQNGSITFDLRDANTLAMSGQRYEEKPTNLYFNDPYQISDFAIELRQEPGRWSWDGTYYLDTDSALNFASLELNVSYSVDITEALVYTDYNSEYSAGVVLVTGLSSQVELTYYDTHIAYRLDEDDDGFFETESIVSYNEL
ncbi:MULTISPECIES: hypothetical protein [unclassified Oleiphilus]|uniref:hypothetical protein n=3 Tax=Oleiphilus TaxID=141450 RepID=UPI0007C30CB9|nr:MULTISPECIES: hypothetical protein [unclassified Oleiphilus]KZY47973.1 hypothetical protein A3732_06250 [Oleiphilus sp. HI0050]KZY76662.1 hypothetical protein A3741_10720 [Oleiphilus sp. HI0069]KZY78916.1 hypothetical protein A3740_07305 [Oleiphilus sp. HI0068]KZY88161.1 hypothetical protein A3741_24745 [Oleiphilus sp. HI0069]KZZ34141.1 hypothetical protein A3757_18310 [Oleiphilus sp. HI0117]